MAERSEASIRSGERPERDETFVRNLPDGTPVNHTLAIGSLGGATLDNEENYLIQKLFSAGLGMVWIEPGARLTQLLRPKFGRELRKGSGDAPAMGSGQCGLHPRDGVQHGRKSPDCLPLRLAGKGARGDPHTCRSAVHPHLRAVRHLCTAAPGSDIAFLGRHHQLPPRARFVVQGIRARFFQPLDDHRREVQRCQRARWVLLRLG